MPFHITDDLAKAKYTSKKLVNGKWQYSYGAAKPKASHHSANPEVGMALVDGARDAVTETAGTTRGVRVKLYADLLETAVKAGDYGAAEQHGKRISAVLSGRSAKAKIDGQAKLNASLSKSLWPNHQRGNVPGQVPRMSIPSSLTEMPKPFSPSMRLDFATDHVPTTASIVRGLGMSAAHENEVTRTVEGSLSHPELDFRTRLNQATQYMKLDPIQRRALTVRAQRYYREQGADQNRTETLQRRLRGLRKAESFHLVEKAVGERGGVIVGYSAGGKPIYQSVQKYKEARARASKAPSVASNKEAHAALAVAAQEHLPEGHVFRAGSPAATQELHNKLGGGDRGELEADVMTAIQTGKTPEGWEHVSKAVGERGGQIKGYTSSGKPIYESADAGQSAANQASGHGMKRQGLRGKAKKESHAAQSKLHAEAAQHYMDAHKESGDSKHLDAARFQLQSAQLHGKKGGVLAKADPRGGSYHRRVTNKETGKHRYFYSEGDYAKQSNAHVSGRDVLKTKCASEIAKRVGKGCTIDSLKAWASGKYDDEVLKDAIRSSVSSGALVHLDGSLKPAPAEKVGATAKKR